MGMRSMTMKTFGQIKDWCLVGVIMVELKWALPRANMY